ncbi:glycosyl transferase family 1 [Rhizobium sp. Leaf384]|uniref:glycosyltransferase family 4 protein n=1 Tax=unclassified Rhizobium TaxID=2613769 RepID=UPI0007144138|nr:MULTISPECIES: glycosyltransferase family 4 protein [unclassified Rhizobium]KQR76001.1 glycosyl transferase family 1 [Rhizobium sp. Leaf341]KQS76612.1 glycosyl transferase family 1 [Rhizobium sp. Leaf383]KQS77880.1 glycosyl transferase family 1 [Rhizobium sp. Leaf384]
MMPDARKPLIVQVVRQFLPNRGGLEDVVANLCHSLPDRGFRVRVVTCDRLFSEPERGRLPARETIDGIEIVRIPWRGSSRYPVAPAVFRHLHEADLVHVHAIDFFFDALSWGRVLHRRPMVVTTHGGFFHTKAFSALKQTWFNTVTRVSAQGYSEIIGCSEADVRTFAPIAGNRVRLIENGVDIRKFEDAASRVPTRRLVTIGRFSANKRLPLLIALTAALKARHPDWGLDIIGVPSDLTVDRLQAEAQRQGVETAVAIHKGLSNSEIRDRLAKASLFVSASDYEGFGLVAVEAMSAGLLPVLNDNTAFIDLAARHPALLLSDFADLTATADILEAAHARLEARGDALRAELMGAARTYGWSAVADRYCDVYRSVLGPAAAPRSNLSFDETAPAR